MDGYPDAFKLPDKGYPAMSIQEIDSEKVIRGSNEGFADSIKINTALIRRRLRSTRLKCKEVKKGLRGHSNVDILYVRDLVKPGLVEEVEKNLDSYVIDHVGDSGVLEQFAEAKWYSPFPQLQTTKRPDVAVNALLEGRVVNATRMTTIGLTKFASTAACPIMRPPTMPIVFPMAPGSLMPASRSSSKDSSIMSTSMSCGNGQPSLAS